MTVPLNGGDVPINLDDAHQAALNRAINNTISTDIAEFTFSQIVDGLPAAEVANDRYGYPLDIDHPIQNHKTLCAGVMETIWSFKSHFDISSIRIDNNLAKAYQDSPVGSELFKTRLIEAVAVAIHQIAVYLYKLDLDRHKDDAVQTWKPPTRYVAGFRLYDIPTPPSLFNHPSYIYPDQYPNGVADVVGYWTENRILGGVVLFNRKKSHYESDEVFFHSNRKNVTRRIYALTTSQKEKLYRFLNSEETDQPNSPLPILADKENRNRIDPEIATTIYGIFRDRWERKPPDDDFESRRCVKTPLDYPEIEDRMTLVEKPPE